MVKDSPRERLERLVWWKNPADLEKEGGTGENLPDQIDRVAFGGRNSARTIGDLFERFGRSRERGEKREPGS